MQNQKFNHRVKAVRMHLKKVEEFLREASVPGVKYLSAKEGLLVRIVWASRD